MNFHNSKIMEFMGLIHAKINWALVGPNIHDIFFKNDLSEVHNCH